MFWISYETLEQVDQIPTSDWVLKFLISGNFILWGYWNLKQTISKIISIKAGVAPASAAEWV